MRIVATLQKIDWFEIKKDFMMASCLVMIVSMCLSIWTIALGYHNMDLGHNLALVNAIWEDRFNETFVDRGVTGQGVIMVFAPVNGIQVGYLQLVQGWSSLMVTSLLLGVFLTTLRYMRR